MGVALVNLCWMQGDEETVQLQKEKFWIQNLQEKM
jgi:hypothetical protein